MVGRVGSSRGPDAASPREGKRLTGPEAVRLHVTLVAAVALCAGAFWFELRRALGGNQLSWAYVFEWPLFAGFAFYMWWNLLHRQGRTPDASAPKVVAPEHVEMLKAWQEHQRSLAAAERRSAYADPPGERDL